MMNQLELFGRVVDLSHRTVVDTDESMFDRPTPCAEWDVRRLVNHMAITLRFSAAVMDEREIPEDRLSDADVLGDDWRQAFAVASAEATKAFGADGAMERVVEGPVGQMPGRAWISFPTWDLYVHTWDLCAATDRPASGDDALTGPVLAWAEQTFVGPRDVEQIGNVVPVAPDAPAIDRLVAMFGRTP